MTSGAVGGSAVLLGTIVRVAGTSAGGALGAGVPGGRPVADQDELGTVGDGVGRGGLLRPELARVVTAEPLGVGTVHHREVQRRVEPAHPVPHELGIDREARSERVTPGLGHLAQPIEVGPRSFGVDVVGGDRRDTAPVVDAGVEQRAEVVRQVRRRLQVDLGRAGSAVRRRASRGSRRSDTPGRPSCAVRSFGRKFCTITSCTWP